MRHPPKVETVGSSPAGHAKIINRPHWSVLIMRVQSSDCSYRKKLNPFVILGLDPGIQVKAKLPTEPKLYFFSDCFFVYFIFINPNKTIVLLLPSRIFFNNLISKNLVLQLIFFRMHGHHHMGFVFRPDGFLICCVIKQHLIPIIFYLYPPQLISQNRP